MNNDLPNSTNSTNSTNLTNLTNSTNLTNLTKLQQIENFADFFIEQLLDMKHVSGMTKLDNYFYQLYLFLSPVGFLYNCNSTNHYIMNISKYKIINKKIAYCCDFVSNSLLISHYTEICDVKWYNFLKFFLCANSFDQNGKHIGYDSKIKCVELFAVIVVKLEKLEYQNSAYSDMIKQFESLKNKIETINNDMTKISKKIIEIKAEIDKSCIESIEINVDLHKQLHDETVAYKNMMFEKNMYGYLKSVLTEENIRKVKNIKIFIDAVSKNEEFKIAKNKYTEIKQSVLSGQSDVLGSGFGLVVDLGIGSGVGSRFDSTSIIEYENLNDKFDRSV
jgi:hypothetical protein